ncbi:MAG: magnesium transporter [Parachlamydiaceae bacterium]|nr:magnesium transporter [Parachlamydiaceae bacterium]
MNNYRHIFPNDPFTPENIHQFSEGLTAASTVDLVDLIASRPIEEELLIFNVLPAAKSVRLFEYLPFKIQKRILASLPSLRVVHLLNALSPDDRTALLEELPTDLTNQLLKYLSPEERTLSIKLLGYPEDSVGRLMTPDYVAIKMDWTVRHVLDYIRENGKDSETINIIYAVDDDGKLIDDFRIREFLFASLDAHVKDLSDHKFIALNVGLDEEQAVNIFRKYERVALPVIDNKGMLLGIVTFDDIMAVAVEEDTEDFQKVGGNAALNEPYMEIPFFSLMYKRIGWLVILFLGEMLTASAMGYFADEIAKAVVLALFLPLIISSGGNAGSQASTLIIRALALGEVSLKDWWRVMRREIFSGIFLGFFLGLIGFFRVAMWSYFSDIYGVHWLLIGVTIFFALIGIILWGTLSGSMLPLILKRCGFDPAVSSAPFVATLVDVTGLIIYFSIAMIVLKGTLL